MRPSVWLLCVVALLGVGRSEAGGLRTCKVERFEVPRTWTASEIGSSGFEIQLPPGSRRDAKLERSGGMAWQAQGLQVLASFGQRDADSFGELWRVACRSERGG